MANSGVQRTSVSPLNETRYLQWSTPLSSKQKDLTREYNDPSTWPKWRKTLVYGVSVLTTLMAAYSISAYVAGADAMVEEFQSTKAVVLVGMTTFQTGFAIGPMGLA